MPFVNSSRVVAGILAVTMFWTGSAQGQPTVSPAADPAGSDKYVGAYQLSPRLVLRITHDGEHFHVQLTHQSPFEVTPDGKGGFETSDQIGATFDFTTDEKGAISGLVLHQHGQTLPARRIDAAQANAVEAGPGPRNWPVLATSAPKRLTHDGSNYWPCFSPDGRSVLFAHTTDGQRWALFRISASGDEMEPVAKEALSVSATRPSWSSTSGAIAFTGTTKGHDAIWVMDGNGAGAHPLNIAGVSAEVDYPSWYPDGRRLAAMDAGDLVIRRVDLNGGPAETLTDHSKVLTGMPSVSPDGQWIVFAGQANSGQPYDQGQNSLWLLGPRGELKPLESAPTHGRAPVWSPDGTRIAFESDRGSPDGRYAIFTIGRDGAGLAQVTDYALNATHPVWSPDGRRMVFAVQDGAATQVAIVDLP
jgi:Tol biopolymer transport system component